jgi:hypothetical protein
MADTQPNLVERIGGSSRFVTLLTMVIHFVHPLLCIANYLDWVRYQTGGDSLGERVVQVYLAMTIIAVLAYLLIASVFYMWAWRYPEPEEVAKRRRIYGVVVNLIFSDLPIFFVEVDIVWSVGFQTGLQGTSFIFTILSLLYSGLRVWTFFMVKIIKVQAPVVGAHAGLQGPATRNFDGPSGFSPGGDEYDMPNVNGPPGAFSPGARSGSRGRY